MILIAARAAMRAVQLYFFRIAPWKISKLGSLGSCKQPSLPTWYLGKFTIIN